MKKMTTQVRSTRPKCPECGFSIFNRRFAKCESCGAQLPTSIVYTADELAVIQEIELAEAVRTSQRKGNVQTEGSNYSLIDPFIGVNLFD